MEFYDKQDGKWIFTIINNKNMYISEIEKEKLINWAELIDWIVTETQAYLDNKATEKANELKSIKKEEIDTLVSLSDQLNLLADTVEILAEWNTDPRLDNARAIFTKIKTILLK